MFRFALACCCAFVLGAAPAAAQTAPATPAPAAAAVAASPEALKIAAAMEKVTSFRMLLSAASGMGGTVTVLRLQKRTKSMVAMGSMTTEMVTADGHMYMRVNGGDWRVLDMPAGGSLTEASLKSMADAAKIRVLPDRVENGAAVSVYEVTPPLPPGAPAGTALPQVTCTYDKTTHLPRTCTTSGLTMTFEGWGDPANVVDVPVVASPAPAVSPHP